MLGNRRGKSMKEYVADYTVFDLETTGTSPKNDLIIEISAVKVRDGQVTDTFSSLVNPGRPIPYGATAVNGISDDMVADQPALDIVFPRFLAFIGDDVLVGHNIHTFDMKFIWKAAEELCGKTISNDYVDTLPMARRCLLELSHHRLVDIAAYYGISTAGAHRALNDCLMNQQCFERMAKEPVKAPQKVCPICGGEMRRRNGRFGEFWGCSEFPACRYTENG
ncbi:MAG: topoisomerase DNA-binding C4 zinc finger domain-containing protein [Lachnospiraceae bacterium]|nr:topoisomerase DNA-binding C4 zinc finger domain-containing protein [Lachnospiraceae bacterium]